MRSRPDPPLTTGMLAVAVCIWALVTTALVVGKSPRAALHLAHGWPAPSSAGAVSYAPTDLLTPLTFDRVASPPPAEPAQPDDEWELEPRRRIPLRVLFLGEPLGATPTRLQVSPAWAAGRDRRLVDGLDIRLDQEDLERVAEGLALELDVSVFFRIGTPVALVLRASSGDRSGLTVIRSEQPEGGLDARIWLDSGVQSHGRVVPAGPGQVGAFLVMDGAPTSMLVDLGAVQADGNFTLSLPGGNDYAFCVFGTGRPGTQVAHVGFASEQSLPTVFLPPEMVIDGALSLAPGWAQASVSAALIEASGIYRAETDEFAWIDGAFEWRSRLATLEPDGQLRISGLAPARYDLRVSSAKLLARGPVGRLPTLTVRAPASGVYLAPRMARVRLEDPHAKGWIGLTQEFGQGGTSHLQAATDADGVAEFWLDPDAPAWVRGLEHTRFFPRELDGREPYSLPAASGR